MAQKDLESKLGAEVALSPQAIATDTTTDGAAINMSGAESVMFAIAAGTLTDGDYTPVVLEGDDNNISNASAVADADLLPSGTGQEATAALSTSNTASKLGYRGTKQYVFLQLVSANVTSGGTLAAVAIKGDRAQNPA